MSVTLRKSWPLATCLATLADNCLTHDRDHSSYRLWARIFAYIQPVGLDGVDLAAAFSQYHKLRLVSKQSCEVFDRNQHLGRLVSLPGPTKLTLLKSFLEWLSCGRGPIEKLALLRNTGVCQEIVLGALLSGHRHRCSLTAFHTL